MQNWRNRGRQAELTEVFCAQVFCAQNRRAKVCWCNTSSFSGQNRRAKVAVILRCKSGMQRFLYFGVEAAHCSSARFVRSGWQSLLCKPFRVSNDKTSALHACPIRSSVDVHVVYGGKCTCACTCASTAHLGQPAACSCRVS